MAWMIDLANMLRLSLIVYMVAGAALSFAYFEGVYLLVALISVTRHMQAVELRKRGLAASLAEAAPPQPPTPQDRFVPAWEQAGAADIF
jgi:hypothetical protein